MEQNNAKWIDPRIGHEIRSCKIGTSKCTCLVPYLQHTQKLFFLLRQWMLLASRLPLVTIVLRRIAAFKVFGVQIEWYCFGANMIELDRKNLLKNKSFLFVENQEFYNGMCENM